MTTIKSIFIGALLSTAAVLSFAQAPAETKPMGATNATAATPPAQMAAKPKAKAHKATKSKAKSKKMKKSKTAKKASAGASAAK